MYWCVLQRRGLASCRHKRGGGLGGGGGGHNAQPLNSHPMEMLSLLPSFFSFCCCRSRSCLSFSSFSRCRCSFSRSRSNRARSSCSFFLLFLLRIDCSKDDDLAKLAASWQQGERETAQSFHNQNETKRKKSNFQCMPSFKVLTSMNFRKWQHSMEGNINCRAAQLLPKQLRRKVNI